MIYLDHHAATPLSPQVRAAMASAYELAWANPESVHAAGRRARAVREATRKQVAGVLGAKAADVVLAGTGTEALNLAVLGIAHAAARQGRRHVVTSAVEHPAVSAAVEQLVRTGFQVDTVDAWEGRPASPAELEPLLRPDTACVALQWVNHETGTLLPVEGYAQLCRERGVPLVVDGCQALGRVPVDVIQLGAAAVVVAAAKVGGPAGVSALWHERCVEIEPLLVGGSQERGYRPGTPDTAALAGFGAAAAGVPDRLVRVSQMAALRDRLEQACVALGGHVNGAGGPRVASVTNLSFPGWRGDVLVAALDVEGLCVSAGAACSSGLGAPSPVLRAMYPEQPWRAESAIRLSLGPETSEAEVEQAIAILKRVLARAPRA